jgi:hypothetical protein
MDLQFVGSGRSQGGGHVTGKQRGTASPQRNPNSLDSAAQSAAVSPFHLDLDPGATVPFASLRKARGQSSVRAHGPIRTTVVVLMLILLATGLTGIAAAVGTSEQSSNPATASNEIQFFGRCPSAPQKLFAYGWIGEIRLGWFAPVDRGSRFLGYRLYRGTAPANESYLTFVYASGDFVRYNDTTVVKGVRYYYYVRAAALIFDYRPPYRWICEGPRSNEVAAIVWK